jgi:hypothetical protein
VTQIVSGDTWSAIACENYPHKVMYGSPDEASCRLREFAVALMSRGRPADGLTVYRCRGNGMTHYHIGRLR